MSPTVPAPPAWLEAFQTRFTSVLRAPLDRSTGSLSPRADHYDPEAIRDTRGGPHATASERLAVYNRQVWCRLFNALHDAFPLTVRLLGYWSFNGWAARYLGAHPPRGWDLDDVGERFVGWLEAVLAQPDAALAGADSLQSIDPHLDARMLIEAARIDEGFRTVFRAPPVPTWRPTAEDAERLLDAHLVESPAFVIVEEHSALLALRRRVLQDRSEDRFAPPAPGPSARAAVLVRAGEATLEMPLEPREADLLRLLRLHSVREAVGQLEAACPPSERAALPAQTRAWLARGVARGWWMGMRGPAGALS